MHLEQHTSLQPIRERWDALLGEQHWLHSSYLLFLEHAQLPDIGFRYVVVYSSENLPLALAYFQVTEFSLRHYRFPIFRNALLQWVEQRLMRRSRQIVTCGNLFQVNSPGLHFLTDDLQQQHQVMHLLLQTAASYGPNAAVLLFKDWPAEATARALREQGFKVYSENGTMTLELNPGWKHFNDYLAALRHRYAQRVRKARRRLEPVSCREVALDEIASNSLLLDQLYRQVLAKQTISMVFANARYFVELKKSMGPRARIFFYYLNEKIIAFRTELIHPQELELHLIGLDYAYNEAHWLYFNILYDAIASALQLGMPRVELGRTAQYAKMTAGASKTPFTHYYRIQKPLDRLLARAILCVYQKNIRRKADASLRIFRGQ